MSNFKHLIVAWNRDRGLLKTFDPVLELRLLTEEAKEFFNAETFSHMLVEYADFVFVKTGTKAKRYCNSFPSSFFKSDYANFKALMDWAEEVESEMISILASKAEREDFKVDLETAIHLALSVVIDNNNKKGSEKVNGKVVKSDNQYKPEEVLEKLIYAN